MRTKFFAGTVDAFLDRMRHLFGLAEAVAYHAVLIAYDDESTEVEVAAALHYLGHTLDSDSSVFEL